MKKTTLNIIGMVLVAFASISFFFGVLIVGSERALPTGPSDDGVCEYRSYASAFNPFYRAGCELFEARY